MIPRPSSRRTHRARFETRHAPGTALPLHRHVASYVAVVVDGGYFEASADGMFWCEPGCVTVHPALHAHANRFPGSGARVLNLACPPRMLGVGEGCHVLRLTHLSSQALARLAVPDLPGALREATPVPPLAPASLAQLAAALLDEHPAMPVAALASRLGVSREHLAREFRRSFGLSPATYRTERRLRRTVALLGAGHVLLSRVAQEVGFADHAHLTRTIGAAAGMPPSALRRWLQH